MNITAVLGNVIENDIYQGGGKLNTFVNFFSDAVIKYVDKFLLPGPAANAAGINSSHSWTISLGHSLN